MHYQRIASYSNAGKSYQGKYSMQLCDYLPCQWEKESCGYLYQRDVQYSSFCRIARSHASSSFICINNFRGVSLIFFYLFQVVDCHYSSSHHLSSHLRGVLVKFQIITQFFSLELLLYFSVILFFHYSIIDTSQADGECRADSRRWRGTRLRWF
jgi:hypothetical protein